MCSVNQKTSLENADGYLITTKKEFEISNMRWFGLNIFFLNIGTSGECINLNVQCKHLHSNFQGVVITPLVGLI